MRSIWSIVFCVMCIGVAAPSTNADLVFRIAQTSPTGSGGPLDLQIGNPSAGVFSIFVSSTIPGQTLRGLDFNLQLNDQSGLGGQMVSGTNDFLVTNTTNPDGFFPGSFPATTVVYGNQARTVGATPTVGTSESLFATVTLSTEGAAAGTYSISLSEILALNVDDEIIGISTTSTLSTSYTISAVPEPTSIALVCAAGAGLWGFRRRAKVS